MQPGPSTPYGGLTVVDLCGGLPAGYCTKLLTDGGADVFLGEPADGDPLRRWRIGDEPPIGTGALFRYLRHGQHSFTVDPDAFISSADVVIVGSAGPEPSELIEMHPGLIVLSITPYGRTGPYAARAATEFTMQCDVGSTASRGLLSQEPFHAGGRTGDWFAGACGAVAVAAAVRRQRLSGHGEVIDLAVAEAINLAMTMFNDLQSSFHDRKPIGKAPRTQETPSIEPTSDGYVGFNTNTRQQLGDFCLMIGRPEEADRFATARDRTVQWDDWNNIVHEFTTTQTTAEIIEFASMLRIPVAPVGNGETAQQIDHFVERGVFIDDPEGDFRMPRRPWRVNGLPLSEPRAAPDIGGAEAPDNRTRIDPVGDPDLPLAGMRILDATAWWAGPTCTAALAALGAEVIHVESVSRPDGMRMIGGYFRDQGHWWERSWIYQGANTNKLGLTLDLTTDRGRGLFVDLAATSDVVVENFTPRVFENFGFDYSTLSADNPSLILARMPAFGLDGPWRDRPGFAQTMEQVTGLAWVTGHRDDQPRIQKGPCDPNAGMHAAFAILGAIMERDRTGKGAELELTMVEAALAVAAEQVIEHSAYGTLMQRGGNRGPYGAPQGIYAADAPEHWVGLAVETDAQWTSLAHLIDRPDLAGLTGPERRARHDELDEAIGVWTQERSDESAVEAMLALGVPAAVVRNPHDTHRHPQFVHRSFVEHFDNPAIGRHPVAVWPYRYASIDRWLTRGAPMLGEHNHQILSGLGLNEDEIAELQTAGVIGDSLDD